jgi:hypothetical protein
LTFSVQVYNRFKTKKLYFYFFLKTMQNVKKITVLETFPVRHAVLQKGKPIETCQFEGDDLPITHHFGYLLNNELTGIISIFKNNNGIFAPNNQYQILGMAFEIKDIGEHYLMVKNSNNE